jgi:hypothetical protein
MNLAFIYLSSFERTAAGILTDSEMWTVELQLLANPRAGAVVPGAGGVRKLRVAVPGQGKRGGARVIYLYVSGKDRIYFILAYAKNQKSTLTATEKQQIAAVVRQLKEE